MIIAAAAGFAFAQGSFIAPADVSVPADVDGIESLYLAKDNGKGKAGDATTSFVTTDIPIYCVIQLDSFRAVTVKMTLIAVEVRGVDAETRVTTVSYKTNGMQDRVSFQGKPKGKWVPGKYRADIYIDDVLTDNVEFDIAARTAVRKK